MQGRLARVLLAGLVALAGAAAIVFAAEGDDSAARASDEWAALSPSPLRRTEVGAARVGDGIYVVGGFDAADGTTGAMVRYDISEDAWEEVAPLPIAVNHPGVTALAGRVYLLGGNLQSSGGQDAKSDRLYRYDPGRDRWRRLADAPSERAAMGFAGRRDRLYAAGGYTASDPTVRELAIYDVDRDRWFRGPRMPTGRNHVGAAFLTGRLVVTGGRPGPVDGGLATVESYDPGRRRWSALPDLGTARSGHAAIATAGRLVVFGGEELAEDGTTIEQVESLRRGDPAWTQLPPMLTPRHGLGGVSRKRRVYAVEGGPEPGLAYSDAIEFLDLPR